MHRNSEGHMVPKNLKWPSMLAKRFFPAESSGRLFGLKNLKKSRIVLIKFLKGGVLDERGFPFVRTSHVLVGNGVKSVTFTSR